MIKIWLLGLLLVGCDNSFEVLTPCRSYYDNTIPERVIRAIEAHCPSNKANINISYINKCPHRNGDYYYMGDEKVYKVTCIDYPRRFIK